MKAPCLYLRKFGFNRPTVVEYKNDEGEFERVETIHLTIEEDVKIWKRCFLLFFDTIIHLYCTKEMLKSISQKVLGTSVVEVFYKEGVICLEDECATQKKLEELKNGQETAD